MYAFEKKGTFFHTLHPVTLLSYLLVVVIGTILVTNPLILIGFMTTIVLCLIPSKSFNHWVKSLRIYFYMIVTMLIINLLINNMGRTVLWVGPTLPVLGRITLSLETIVFSLVMGLRLLIIFSTFFLYNKVMDPDKALSVSSKIFPKSALLVALTTKTIPYMSQQLQSAAEIQQCRGVKYYSGSYIDRIKSRFPLIKVLLLSSLEDSFNLGESIQARAYGSGKRSCYHTLTFRWRDYLVLLCSLLVLIGLSWSGVNGWIDMTFFPRIGKLIVSNQQLFVILIIIFFMIAPVILAWGWEKWDYLKLKI